ncbi:MAG: hypothetical protein ACP5RI_01445 [Candidatus Micrarchaeia archaeon]
MLTINKINNYYNNLKTIGKHLEDERLPNTISNIDNKQTVIKIVESNLKIQNINIPENSNLNKYKISDINYTDEKINYIIKKLDIKDQLATFKYIYTKIIENSIDFREYPLYSYIAVRMEYLSHFYKTELEFAKNDKDMSEEELNNKDIKKLNKFLKILEMSEEEFLKNYPEK